MSFQTKFHRYEEGVQLVGDLAATSGLYQSIKRHLSNQRVAHCLDLGPYCCNSYANSPLEEPEHLVKTLVETFLNQQFLCLQAHDRFGHHQCESDPRLSPCIVYIHQTTPDHHLCKVIPSKTRSFQQRCSLPGGRYHLAHHSHQQWSKASGRQYYQEHPNGSTVCFCTHTIKNNFEICCFLTNISQSISVHYLCQLVQVFLCVCWKQSLPYRLHSMVKELFKIVNVLYV